MLATPTDMSTLWINPQDVTRLAEVSCAPITQQRTAEKLGYVFHGDELTGDWDLVEKTFANYTAEYHRWLNGSSDLIYDSWDELDTSIKEEGYRYEPDNLVPVCIARDGEIILVDGRHRMVVAQENGIEYMPVEVAYVHPEYQFGNLLAIHNPCVPEFVCDRIIKKFDYNNVYHSQDTILHRFLLAHDFLPLLAGHSILDLGCNSALMSWALMEYAAGYVGVEPHEGYYRQAHIVLDCFSSRFQGCVINGGIMDVDLSMVDALYASFVLYHLQDYEVKYLLEEVLPKMKVVIIPNRNRERPSALAGNPVNNYALNRPENIAKLLHEAGLKIEIWNDGNYSVITSTRF